MTHSTITCRWVPGTLDRVRLTTPTLSIDAPVKDVRNALGRPAEEALYLRGRYDLRAADSEIEQLLRKIGGKQAPVEPTLTVMAAD